MNNSEAIAKCLIAERFNATELSEALEITRQSALMLIRRIDRNRLRNELSGACRAGRGVRTVLSLRGSSLGGKL